MNQDEAERITWKILGEVEELMSEDGVAVRLENLYGTIKAKAFFPDREYKILETAIAGILLDATMMPATLPPRTEEGHHSSR